MRRFISRATPHRDKLEAKWRTIAAKQLTRERLLNENYDSFWENECAKVKGRLSAAEHLRFLVLHRQFWGSGMPGLSQAVQTIRLVLNQIKRRIPWA